MFYTAKILILNAWMVRRGLKVISRVVAEIPRSTSESLTSYHMLNICLTTKEGATCRMSETGEGE